jgi:ABC-type Fe3+ transport system permease subunit
LDYPKFFKAQVLSPGLFVFSGGVKWAREISKQKFESRSDNGRAGVPDQMARWPRHFWTTLFTYGTIFLLFPLLSFLAYAFVRGWLF